VCTACGMTQETRGNIYLRSLTHCCCAVVLRTPLALKRIVERLHEIGRLAHLALKLRQEQRLPPGCT
jgi:hypothetical protein